MVNGAVLYLGSLYHKRSSVVTHEFTYPAVTLAVDIDQLDQIRCAGFGHNRWSLFSIWDRDYLFVQNSASLREKVLRFLNQINRADLIHPNPKIVLVTSPKLFGMGFNPVSFFYVYHNQTLSFVLAEVNNTFGETHIYLVETPGENPTATGFCVQKEFHVSPFFDRLGQYEFKFKELNQRLAISIILKKEDQIRLIATLTGQGHELNSKTVLQFAGSWAASILMTFPRILVQGLILALKHRLSEFKKPIPNHPLTFRRKPRFWSLTKFVPWIKNTVLAHFSKLHDGHLEITFPDRQTQCFGDESKAGYPISIHDDRFFTRSALFGEIGFGESYMLGEWDTPNLTQLLEFIYLNLDVLEGKYSLARRFFSHFNNFQHQSRQNSVKNSKKNIQDHYDLSNGMFELFLDDTMSYSSAIFSTESDSLEQAQRAKIDRILELADIQSHHHILEIGCGWGSLSIEAVRKTGCKVTALTLSQQQLEYFNARIQNENLADQISVELCDYRHLSGKFDRIISIEMIEAVGPQYLPEYFRSLDRLLVPTGKVVLQGITIQNERYHSYSNEADWIQKHIFPGGHLPSFEEIQQLVSKFTRFHISVADNIGPHYATTLVHWRNRFLANKTKILELGFSEEFIRKWEFYFCYCEAGFRQNHIQNYQFVLQDRDSQP